MDKVLLPTEIWREVFAHAIYVPGLLTTRWEYDPDDQVWHGWRFVEDTAIRTKRVIVQVCREWRALGTEFLYETIQSRHVDESTGLLATLRASSAAGSVRASDSSSSRLGYGWWTRRLDCPKTVLQPSMFPAFLSLLEQFHNLSILRIARGETRNDIISQLLTVLESSRFAHSLRRLEMKLHEDEAPILDIPLTSISLSSIDMSLKGTLSDVRLRPNSSFETISSLNIDLPRTLGDYPDSLYFPNLRHLGITGINKSDILTLVKLVDIHHRTIISLHLRALSKCKELPILIHHATNTRTFALHDVEFMRMMAQSQSFTGITHVCVMAVCQRPDLRRCLVGIRCLLQDKIFPDLTLLKLLDHSGSISYDSEWVEVIELCGAAGVRLQDGQGHRLVCE